MAEEYKGVKFQIISIQKIIDEDSILRFLNIDKMLRAFLSPSANEGNLSMRYKNGFLIKRAGSKLTMLQPEDVVFVDRVIDNKVFATGNASSESIMHYEIYRARADATIVLHFHDDVLLKKRFQYEVGPFSYGTRELAAAVADVATRSNLIKIREHGFVLITRDSEELKNAISRLKR
ncbi:MAG: class II aldolase/adducin family protein [Candidatus Bilamarchaeaceae archaeon]